MSYLKNSTLLLRALEPHDLESLYAWENNSAFWHTGSTIEPYSRHLLTEFIEQMGKNIFENKQLRLVIERRKDGTAIGAVDLFDYDHIHNRAAVGLFIAPEEQGKGYGKQALQLIIDYAFNHLHMQQLYAHVGISNSASMALFTASKFEQVGLLKHWMRNRLAYEDVALFQLLNPTIHTTES